MFHVLDLQQLPLSGGEDEIKCPSHVSIIVA